MSLGFAPSGVGFYGKIPTRGDFVGAGLPRDLVDQWDGWCRLALHESRQALGEPWLAAWMEAPIWRFRLAPGCCGAAGVLGVMLPSVDRAGRHFPFMLAAFSASGADLCEGAEWLAQGEQIGLAAVLDDLAPDDIASRLAQIDAKRTAFAWDDAPALWWTDGAPRRAAGQLRFTQMPPPALFASMLSHSETIL